ncbi:MAG TPA: TIGR01459 family HAD-type hydrolase [Micropepsaceae bacterium]|nr:TIGR01459 family HAD-type hydrolase [Micropepsaceae bacterium]
MTAPPILSTLSEIAADYDAAICDVWGVIHNGRDAYFSAIEAMRRFRAERGPVILLSNAPRLADGVEYMFKRIGVPFDFYDAIVTGGEAARAELEARTAGGKELKLFYLGPERDHLLFAGLPLKVTPAEEAEAVLCTGFYDDETEAPDDYRPLLETFLARKLVFLCANPDIVVQRGDRLIYCAGAIAKLYEAMGGEAIYYGKPHRPVFERALQRAQEKGAGERPLVIGDGIGTDILGANRMGWDALFVASGIHGAELKAHPGAIVELLVKEGVRVRAAMTELRW